MKQMRLIFFVTALLATAGCGLQSGFKQKDLKRNYRDVFSLKETEALANFPTGAAQLGVLCARPGQDKVRKAFCNGARPDIRSLVDLQRVLGLEFSATNTPSFALLGHSTSLVTQSVSSINPRAFVFSLPTSDFVAMSFVRGEPFVEIAAGDPSNGSRYFFLVAFTQACDRNNSCGNGDRLTPAIEKDWQSLTVYEDEDLKNTILDCRQCHQPNGPGTKKILRMQELEIPWTHWFEPNLDTGKALLADFQAAHGTNEPYGGIPGESISQSNPPALEAFVKNLGDSNQPNVFNSAQIEKEGNPGPTWQGIFDTFLNGRAIPVPYFGLRISDPNKLAQMTADYQKFRNGILPASQLTDIRKVFPDDANTLADMGFRVRPGQSPQQILVNACAQCHNSKLDQTISRALFNVDLSKTSSAVRKEAIKRINMNEDSLMHMPPKRFRSLTTQEIQQLTQYLSN